MIKKKELPFMEVIWLDASSEDGWIDDTTDLAPPVMITRGWLYKDEEKYLVLVNSLVKEGDGSVGGSNTIPKGMIVSSRMLRVSNENKNKKPKPKPVENVEI